LDNVAIAQERREKKGSKKAEAEKGCTKRTKPEMKHILAQRKRVRGDRIAKRLLPRGSAHRGAITHALRFFAFTMPSHFQFLATERASPSTRRPGTRRTPQRAQRGTQPRGTRAAHHTLAHHSLAHHRWTARAETTKEETETETEKTAP